MNIVLTYREKKLLFILGAIFVITVLGPGSSLQFAHNYVAKQSALKQSLEEEAADLQARLASIEDERQAVRADRENYLTWVERGVVGRQEPVAWVKVMQKIGTDRGLFPLTYDFEDEVLQPSEGSPFTEDSTVQIRFRNMTMDMAMLHDMDTLMFLETLDKEVDSFFFPSECSFHLVEPDFSLEHRPNMMSDCTLVWVSVHDPETKVSR